MSVTNTLTLYAPCTHHLHCRLVLPGHVTVCFCSDCQSALHLEIALDHTSIRFWHIVSLLISVHLRTPRTNMSSSAKSNESGAELASTQTALSVLHFNISLLHADGQNAHWKIRKVHPTSSVRQNIYNEKNKKCTFTHMLTYMYMYKCTHHPVHPYHTADMNL